MISPLIRWAGGKSRIAEKVISNFPNFSGTYYEPFLGSGVIYLNTNFTNASVLSDANWELVNFHTHIQNCYNQVFNHAFYYENTKEQYNDLRKDFKYNSGPGGIIWKAARFLYLNKTSFQGLWRVNSDGYYNVSYGYKKNLSLDMAKAKIVSDKLKSATIKCEDFESVLQSVQEGDFVYLDPPYIPVSKTSSFTAYTPDAFDNDKHNKVKTVCDYINSKGAKFLLSNSDCLQTRDLYKSYNVEEIEVRRSISAKVSSRGIVKELLIKNY